jgi:iron complex outermembrane receptor protein
MAVDAAKWKANTVKAAKNQPHPVRPEMQYGRRTTAALLLLTSTGIPAQTVEMAGKTQAVERMVITATREEQVYTDAPASVTIITAEDIERRRAARIGDVLGEVPGLYIRNNAMSAQFPSSGQASIALRGVPRTTRALVMVDGQPINNALSGGIDLSSIMLENVRRIEVVRGPYSALYGGNAMGGVVNVLTRVPDRRELQGHAEWGFGDASSSSGSLLFQDRLDNGFAWNMGAGYCASSGGNDSDYVVKSSVTGAGTIAATGAQPTTTADGRAAALVGTKGRRPWNQKNADAKFVFQSDADTTLSAGIAFSAYRTGYGEPQSYLRTAAGAPVFSGSVNAGTPFTGRLSLAESDFLTFTPASERDWRTFIRWERKPAAGVQIVANVGYMSHVFRFTQPASTARYESGAGDWTDQPNQRSDADLHARWQAIDDLWLTVGGAINRQHLDRRNYSAGSWRDFGSRTAETGRGSGITSNEALFVQAEYSHNGNLTLYGGGRFDRFATRGEVTQNTAPAFSTTYALRREQQFSPKVAMVFEPRRDLTFRASYGEGFRPPTLLDLYSRTVSPTTVAGVNSVNEPAPDLRAERIKAWETGFDFHRDGTGEISAAAFMQTLSDLIYRNRVSATLTQSANAGTAKVDGLEISLRKPLSNRQLTLFATATHLLRYQIVANTALPASVGHKLTDVPDVMYSGGVEFAFGLWKGSLVIRHVGHVFGSGDDLNINVVQGVYGSYDRHTISNAKLSYQAHKNVSVAVSIDNLANRQYFDFYKQPGMTGLLEVTLRY